MKRIFLILFVIVLFCIPFIGWETGWQTAPVSFVNILIYIFIFIIGLLTLLKYIQKKHLPNSRLVKISIIIALLFSPLIVTLPLVFVAADMLLPSGLILPLTVMDLITVNDSITTIPFHYFIVPVITFLFVYSMLWIVTRRYHLFPDRRTEWNKVFLSFLKSHKRHAIIIGGIFTVVVALRILSQSWISRYYLPISDENTTLITSLNTYAHIKVPQSNIFVDINCQDLKGFNIFLLSDETTECFVSSFFVLEKESGLNFNFTNKQFELRDIKNHDYIYPYTVHITSESFGDIDKYEGPKDKYTRKRYPSIGPPHRRLVLRYIFKTLPKQIELVIPAIQIEGKEYELSPIRFEYTEELKFGR